MTIVLDQNPAHEAATAELLSYYDGQHLPWLRSALKKRLSEADVMAQVMEACNLVRPLVQLLSPAYTPEPHRELLGAPGQLAAWEDFLRQSRWEDVMEEANHLATLCGVAAVKVAVGRARRRWTMQALPPNQWWAAAHAEAPEEMAAFVHESVLGQSAAGPRVRTYGYTDQWVWWRDSDGPLADRADVFDETAPLFDETTSAPVGRTPNRYGRIPVVLVYGRRPRGGVKPPPDETLLSRQQAINLKLTGRNFNLVELGFSQLVLKGQWDKSIRRSVTEPIKVPTERGGDFASGVEYLTPNPFVAEHHAAIENTWDLLAREHGLDPDTLRGRRTSTSGYHQELKDQRLRELKTGQCRRRARDEQALFDLVRVVSQAEADLPLKLGPQAALSVVFSPFRAPRDEAQEWALLKEQVLAGVRPVDDLVRLVRPDLATAQAVSQWLDEVRLRNRQATELLTHAERSTKGEKPL